MPSGKSEKGMSGCTGVFVSPYDILTAQHCVEGSIGKQWIKRNDGKILSAKIIAEDKIEDLALLHVDKPSAYYTHLGEEPFITDEVFTVNSGESLEKTFGKGIVANITKIDDMDHTPSILSTIVIFHGASGSGLFNSNGDLIGLNVAIFKGQSIAVDTPVIYNFLHFNHIN